jgi:hypothetical protein
MPFLKHWGRFLIVLFTLTLLFGCSSEEEAPPTAEAPKGGGALTDSATDSSQMESKSLVQNNSKAGTLPSTQTITKKMIYTANIDLTVKNYNTAKNDLEKLVNKYKGYMVNSNEKSEEDIEGYFTYRIPQDKFNAFLKELPKLSKSPPAIEITGTDVTEEMVDLQSRLKAKQAMEKRLLDLMEKATKSEDLLAIATQLDTTQEQIEQIKGRLNYLNNQIDYSTVNIKLEQNDSHLFSSQPIGQQMSDAFSDSIAALGTFAVEALVFLAGALPIIIIVAILIVLMFWIRRRRKQKPFKK